MDTWDVFLGAFELYLENYGLVKNNGGAFSIKPSYKVDYKIKNFKQIEEQISNGAWYNSVLTAKNINDLPVPFKTIAIEFLPRFYTMYPKHKNAECLKIK